ncbi:UDP-3-O-(3-hydroxymyristoyl)glucosamine N-acyltransferase [Actibacterium sp. 188UL27-1]|uniref:UDP-3-O-(3-hydroxymyristoyl)glucosamine N-acyltransferase n=1 Tax=Actibacterium sp. 188UL27-1 TaxID=2786961 RepID=UPI00195A50BF|nr:UDP-3-O-(3-hydroxymyristoyl)glucosamine N-acyltransferase [Actibacterium sp. 188UL27-1]MBM7067419.1 UDP-3-O-(3-hydroxymyristoyl)glucosamine N-acyltransferase [Actibacterium sp. 188UL27-1]
MGHTIAQIAQALGAQAEGDLGLVVSGAAEPALAGPTDLAIAIDPKYAMELSRGSAAAALLWEKADWASLGLKAAILTPRGRFAMSGVTRMLDLGPQIAGGQHPTAVIDASAQIGHGAAIAPFAVIGPGAVIGSNACIGAHVCIGPAARIGEDALILDGVRIGARVRIGDRFIAQPGAVIGGDGFSFVTPEKGAIEAVRESLGQTQGLYQQKYARIHSLGAVRIGDDVEIGANSSIDRGTIRDTQIGTGTKIDSLVQVGHNAVVGQDCLLCGQVGIAGSTVLGDRVVLGGQCGVTDHLQIGDDVIAGAGTLLRTNQPAGRVMLGNPAMPMQASIDAYKGLRRLPRLMRDIAALKKVLSKPDGSD